MQREWSAEALIGSWTLVDEDWPLVSNKSGPTRLGFALLLKFFKIEARVPRNAGELPTAAGRNTPPTRRRKSPAAP